MQSDANQTNGTKTESNVKRKRRPMQNANARWRSSERCGNLNSQTTWNSHYAESFESDMDCAFILTLQQRTNTILGIHSIECETCNSIHIIAFRSAHCTQYSLLFLCDEANGPLSFPPATLVPMHNGTIYFIAFATILVNFIPDLHCIHSALNWCSHWNSHLPRSWLRICPEKKSWSQAMV